MSKAQEEVECGPRTVCSILHVVQQLTKNRDIEDIVMYTEEELHISRTTPLKLVPRQICKHIMKYPNNIPQLPVKIIESSQYDENEGILMKNSIVEKKEKEGKAREKVQQVTPRVKAESTSIRRRTIK